MRKLLYILIILIASINSFSQDVVGSRVIAKQSFFLKDNWVDSLRRDTLNWANDFRTLPTTGSVYKFVLGRIPTGAGTGSVTSISQGYGIINTPNPITTTGSVKLDSATVFPQIRATIPSSSGGFFNPNQTSTGNTVHNGNNFNFDVDSNSNVSLHLKRNSLSEVRILSGRSFYAEILGGSGANAYYGYYDLFDAFNEFYLERGNGTSRIGMTPTNTTSQIVLAAKVGANGSYINVEDGLLSLEPRSGNLLLYNLTNLSTQNRLLGQYGTSTQVGYITIGTGASLSSGVLNIAPPVSSITGLGTGVATALAVNIGSAGAFVTFNGALGTPSSGTGTNITGIPEGGLSLTDITTNNTSTTKHGFFPKLTSNTIYYVDNAGALTALAFGTTGKVLTTNGATSAPTWETPSAGGTTWNAITDPTGDQALTFGAGESSTWTDQNTTEDLFTVNSSTGTTNSMFSLNRTGTALAAGNNIMEIISSGANGTNAITATGLDISVTNTNGTSGTNVGLNVTASGATTANYAALFNGGRVGINETAPQSILQVGEDGGTSSGFGSVAQITFTNNGSATYVTGFTGTVQVYFGAETTRGVMGMLSNHPYDIRTNNITRLTIAAAGAVTIADLAGSGSRAVLADASGVLSAPVSDRSVKKNIQPLNYGLETIMKLNPVSFEYKDGWKNYGVGKQIGFIAQDIQKVLPNSAFTTPSTGKMGYNEIDLVPVLTKAIQEQQEQIENLKKEVNKLKKKK